MGDWGSFWGLVYVFIVFTLGCVFWVGFIWFELVLGGGDLRLFWFWDSSVVWFIGFCFLVVLLVFSVFLF